MHKKAVFIDRDGTINVEKGYVHKIEDFEFIPGALEALKLFTKNGVKIYIITNQAGIAKGYFNEEDFQKLTEHMMKIFERESIVIEDVLYCPHHPSGTIPQYRKECMCRKPGTLLIDDVISANRFDIQELALIGDKKSDIDAGLRAGMETYMVLTGYGQEHCASSNATYVIPDILSAAKIIIAKS